MLRLYTNIRVDLVICTLANDFHRIEDPQKAIEFCVKGAQVLKYKYKDTFFQQTRGLGMGNPFSNTLALYKVIDEAIDISQTPLIFLMKYVDDIIAIVKQGTKVNFTRLLSALHSSLSKESIELNIIQDHISIEWWQIPYSCNRLQKK